MRYVVPDEAFRTELVNSIFELHGTGLADYHIYGFRMISEVHSSYGLSSKNGEIKNTKTGLWRRLCM